MIVGVPAAVSPVSESPAVRVTIMVSSIPAVLPEVGDTEVTENVGPVVSRLLVTDSPLKFCRIFPDASVNVPVF